MKLLRHPPLLEICSGHLGAANGALAPRHEGKTKSLSETIDARRLAG